VRSYAWDFGDGGTGTGVTASHTYVTAGTYTVRLRVTDDAGATGSTSSAVTVTAPPPVNRAPTAAFTAAATGLTVGVDGSASSDADGTVRTFAWDFGDGGTGTGSTAAHTYATPGTYTVRLTVTDDGGATGTTSSAVTVTAPPAVLAADSFQRTTTGGWGTATTGGTWTAPYGGSRFSVAAGTGSMSLGAVTNLDEAVLAGVSQTGSTTLAAFSVTGTQTGRGTSVYLVGRRAGANLEYRVRVRFLPDGTVALALTKLAGSATESLVGSEVVVPGLTVASGAPVQVRFTVTGTGTTRLSATVWAAGSPEPATPTLSGTDGTAGLQVPGSVGVAAYLSGTATPPVTVRFTGYQVTAAG
jgi:PKD repeat protein